MTTPRPCADPQDRWRLIRMSTDLLGQFGTRADNGERITAEWGEPDEQGVYEPTFTTHFDPTHNYDRLFAIETAARAWYEADRAFVEAPFGEDEEEQAVAHVAKDALREALRIES